MWILVKTLIVNISAKRPKLINKKPLYFLKVFKLQKIEYIYFFHFWPLCRDIDDLCFLQIFTFGWKNLKVRWSKMYGSESLILLSKIVHPKPVSHNIWTTPNHIMIFTIPCTVTIPKIITIPWRLLSPWLVQLPSLWLSAFPDGCHP